MYTLTLTADERRAFDWVGDRYNSGKVADLLTDCLPEDREWGDDGDITFHIPEHVAWEINELVVLLTKLDLNSRCVFCKPLPHLVVRPRPLHGAGITMIVFWP